MKKSSVIIFVIAVIIVAFAAGIYFKDSLLGVYRAVGTNLQAFEKTNFGNIVSQVQQEIVSPPPLNIGGQANSAVLVKSKIIAQTNIQRYNNGMLAPLIENAKLNAAAQAKAQDIFKNQYFEHVSPSGVDPGTLVKKYGYDYLISGENLILGNFSSEQEVVQDWMNSPGHRANILNNRFVDIGVAIEKGIYQGHTVWVGVQEFGVPLSSCPMPPTALKNQIDANKAQLDQLSAQIDAKKVQIQNSDSHSQEYNSLVNEYNQLVNQYNALAQQTKNFIADYNAQVNSFNQCVAGAQQ